MKRLLLVAVCLASACLDFDEAYRSCAWCDGGVGGEGGGEAGGGGGGGGTAGGDSTGGGGTAGGDSTGGGAAGGDSTGGGAAGGDAAGGGAAGGSAGGGAAGASTLTLTPPTAGLLDLGPTADASFSFLLRNEGTAPAMNVSVAIDGGNFALALGGCAQGGTLAPDASCTLEVRVQGVGFAAETAVVTASAVGVPSVSASGQARRFATLALTAPATAPVRFGTRDGGARLCSGGTCVEPVAPATLLSAYSRPGCTFANEPVLDAGMSFDAGCQWKPSCQLFLERPAAYVLNATNEARCLNVAFLSEAEPAGDIADPDGICSDEAADAGMLPGAVVALLRKDGGSPRSAIQGAGGWVRPDGIPVAATVTDLFGTRMKAPISSTLRTNGLSTNVWTGMRPDAGVAPNCDHWTSSSGSSSGTVGSSSSTVNRWTDITDFDCMFGRRLYCFQTNGVQGFPSTTRLPGRIVFALPGQRPMTNNLLTACQTAGAQVRPGSTFSPYLVLSSGQLEGGAYAQGAPWYRMDGVPVWSGRGAAGVPGTQFSASVPLNVTLDGGFLSPAEVDALAWFGNGSQHCSNWTTTAGSTFACPLNQANAAGACNGSADCNTARTLICIER